MKKYDFIFMYEHKVRELENLCLLKYFLEQKGYSVLIKCLHDSDIYYTSNRVCKPKYYAKVLGIFAFHTNETIRYNVESCIYPEKIINFQWEQMLTPNQEKKGSYCNPSGIGREICHISWSQNNYDRLATVAEIPLDQIFLCGNISFDFLNPKMEEYYYSREYIINKYNLRSYKKICMWFSNFMCAEQFQTNPEELRRRFGDSFIEAQQTALKTCDTLIEWFKNAALAFPDYAFIYRPHPGDNLIDVEKTISTLPNIFVIRDYSSKQWIFVSDYMFSTHSSVVIEAHAANKKCHVLEPYKYQEEEDNEIFSTINPIDTQEKMFDVLSDKNIPTGIETALVEKHFGKITSDLNCVRVAQAFIDVYNNPKYNIEDALKRYDIFKRNINTINQKIWNNPILNPLCVLFIKIGAKIPILKEKIVMFRIYNEHIQFKKKECASPTEMRTIENNIKNVLNKE